MNEDGKILPFGKKEEKSSNSVKSSEDELNGRIRQILAFTEGMTSHIKDPALFIEFMAKLAGQIAGNCTFFSLKHIKPGVSSSFIKDRFVEQVRDGHAEGKRYYRERKK